jgi:hypothetical protein
MLAIAAPGVHGQIARTDPEGAERSRAAQVNA